jgi:hypothetical protein
MDFDSPSLLHVSLSESVYVCISLIVGTYYGVNMGTVSLDWLFRSFDTAGEPINKAQDALPA